MKKVQAVSIPDFMQHGFQVETTADKIKSHLKRNQSFYIQTSGYIVTFLLVGLTGSALAATGTESVGNQIYKKVVKIGKWIIIIKGSIDIIGSMSSGDIDTMKKQVVKYVVGFIALLGLPWVFDQTEQFFSDPSMTIAPGDQQ